MEKEKEDISIRNILIISLIISLIPIIFVYLFHIPKINEIPLNTDPNIYAGIGEVCNTPSVQVNCKEGLECMDLSNKPYVNGVCLPIGYVLPEDFTNRKDIPGEIGNETLVIVWKGDKRTIRFE